MDGLTDKQGDCKYQWSDTYVWRKKIQKCMGRQYGNIKLKKNKINSSYKPLKELQRRAKITFIPQNILFCDCM